MRERNAKNRDSSGRLFLSLCSLVLLISTAEAQVMSSSPESPNLFIVYSPKRSAALFKWYNPSGDYFYRMWSERTPFNTVTSPSRITTLKDLGEIPRVITEDRLEERSFGGDGGLIAWVNENKVIFGWPDGRRIPNIVQTDPLVTIETINYDANQFLSRKIRTS